MKTIKRIFIVILVTGSLLLGTLTIIAIQYEKELLDYVKVELGSQLTKPVDVGSIEYDLFEHFPNVSVSLNHVKTYSFEKGDKPLLDLQRIHLVFDLFSVIHGDFSVHQIVLEEGEVNIMYNQKGLPNYDILKSSEDTLKSSARFLIDAILISDVQVGYFDEKEHQGYELNVKEADLQPAILKDSFALNARVITDVHSLKIDEFELTQSFVLDGELGITLRKKKFTINYDGILNNDAFSFVGLIQTKKQSEWWDIAFKFENHNIEELVKLLPSNFKDDQLKSVNGTITAKGEIKGKKSNKWPPLTVAYALNNVTYANGDTKIKVKHAQGDYSQPTLKNTRGAKINASNFSLDWKGVRIAGSGELSHFERPLIKANLQSEFDLSQIYEDVLKDDFSFIQGNMSVDMQVRGRLIDVFVENKVNALDEFSSKGVLSLENVIAQPVDFDFPIDLSNGTMNFSDKDLKFEDFKGTIQSSSFKMNGQITNYLKTILSNEPITFDANLEMDKMVLEEFVGERDASSSTEEYNFNLPQSIVMRANLKMDEFSFRKFKGEGILGEIELKDQVLLFKKLTLNTCDGVAKFKGFINTQNPKINLFSSQTILKDINAKKAFIQFENFGQDVLLDHHVKGVVSMTSNLRIESDKGLNIKENKLFSENTINIKNGELVQFEPLIELQEFLNDDLKLNFNLSHLKFSTLKNDIKINQGTIYIPEMAIRSSDINLDIEGTHTFDQDINYLLKIKHNEIFKAKKENKIDAEFGVVENNDKTATLPLRMRGNIDDPKFSYDVKSKRQLVKETWKKERQEIGKVLKEEIKNIIKPKERNNKAEKLKEEEEDLNEERTNITQELIWDEEEEEEDEEDEEDED